MYLMKSEAPPLQCGCVRERVERKREVEIGVLNYNVALASPVRQQLNRVNVKPNFFRFIGLCWTRRRGGKGVGQLSNSDEEGYM